MTAYDKQYNEIISDILQNGEQDEPSVVRAKWKDGTPATTISLLNKQISFDNSGDEFGLMTTKFVAPKNPLREMFWIWKHKSNDVNLLNEMGCKVWNEWKREDGTIGRAYGWQLRNKKRRVVIDELLYEMIQNGEVLRGSFDDIEVDSLAHEEAKKIVSIGKSILLDQVDWLLYTLKHPTKKYSRRIATTLWAVEDLDDMALEPCVYETRWFVKGGKLHLIVKIRSNDLALGNPYNVMQYAVLHRMIAQVTDNQVGDITFKIDDAHVYERHIEGLKEQIERPIRKTATVALNNNIKSFYDFKLDDIIIMNYDYSGKSKYEIAI